MQRKWIVIGAALLAALPAALAAQRTPRAPRPARAPRANAYAYGDHHGRIGVVVNFEFFGSPWGDLDLVSLNPDLGEYFGTKEGILVVRAPADSSLPLRAGDVILSVGGRKPASPSHAMRILRSYEAGETVSIDIMRKQKRTTVAWKVPEPEERRAFRKREREEQSKARSLLRRSLWMRRV